MNAWQSSMRIHETMAENRLRFAQRLNEMSDELANLSKEVEKNRKQVCWRCVRHGFPFRDSNFSPDQGSSNTIRASLAGV